MPGSFLADDMPAFFDAAEFADTATFEGSAGTVTGNFDRAFDLAALGGVDVATIAPAFSLPTASVPADAKGRFLRFGNLLAGGSRWRIANVHPLGDVTLLQLQRA